MIKLIQGSLALGLMIFLSSCAQKVKILDVSAVSNKIYSLKSGQKLKETGEVSGQFCSSTDDGGHVGLMDNAIDNATKTHNIQVIKNASFYRKGACMIVEGTGAKVQ